MKRLVLLGMALSSMGTLAQCPWGVRVTAESCPDFIVAIDPQHCFELPVDPCSNNDWQPYAYFAFEQAPIGVTVSGAFQGPWSVQRICTSEPIDQPIQARYLVSDAVLAHPLGAGTITLTGHPMSVHVSATPDRVAPGEYSQLAFTIDGGQPPYTFTWTLNAWFSDPDSPTPLVLPTRTDTFTVTVVDHQGASVTAGVEIAVGLRVVAEAAASSVNEGETVQLHARAFGGDEQYTYQWSPSAGLVGATGSDPYATPAQSTTYTVTVTDGAGQVATAHVTVTVVPPLAAVFHYTKTGTVPPYDVLLDASGSTGAIVRYVWDFSWIIGPSDIDTTSPFATITVHNEVEHGTATLTVVDDQGRTASTTLTRFP